MRRRVLLQRAGAAVPVAALAGCLDESIDDADPGDGDSTDDTEDGGDDADDDTGDDETTDEDGTDETDGDDTGGSDADETDDDSDGAAGASSIASESITTLETSCIGDMNGDDAASVEFVDEGVELTGSLEASDPCHEAALSATTLEEGELQVIVGLEAGDEDEFCQQCLARVRYEATIEFDGGLPDAVTIIHDDREGRTEVVSRTRE